MLIRYKAVPLRGYLSIPQIEDWISLQVWPSRVQREELRLKLEILAEAARQEEARKIYAAK